MAARAALALVLALGAGGCAGSATSAGGAPAAGPPGAAAGAMPAPLPKGADLTLPGETHLRTSARSPSAARTPRPTGRGTTRRSACRSRRPRRLRQIHILDLKSGTLTPIMQQRAADLRLLPARRPQILFASTHELSPDCPPEPDRSHGYTWPLYDYDIYVANRDGSDLHNITRTPGYDAEATVRSDGRIVFTSTRSGDIELWAMDPDGGNLQQLTHTTGYDGGAYFSPDGSKLIWRASRPAAGQEEDDYKALLAQNLVRPTKMELWTANADGSGAYQLTTTARLASRPTSRPTRRRSSSRATSSTPRARLRNLEAEPRRLGLEQVTHDPSGFNAFPMFSRDGKRLVFSSNRNGSVPHETNVFVAEWVP
jgi:hypothetical protein